MDTHRLNISTIASDARACALRYGLGLELACYCDSTRLDEGYDELRKQAFAETQGCATPILHAPYAELAPCAIDPQARELARRRYRQAIAAARDHGAHKIVVHSGYNPKSYYPVWFCEQSLLFWREFVQEIPSDMVFCLENVFEENASFLADILQGVQSPRLRMCLDVGHVNAYSQQSLSYWIQRCEPYLEHIHIHNNDGMVDGHEPLFQGTIDILGFVEDIAARNLDVTFSLEMLETTTSLRWLVEQGILEGVDDAA